MIEKIAILIEAGIILALMWRIWHLENVIESFFGGEEEPDND